MKLKESEQVKSFKIDKDKYNDFKKYCNKKNLKIVSVISDCIEVYIDAVLEKEINKKKKVD